MYVKLTVQERLKGLRVVEKKLTLEELAEQTGLSRSALGQYESNDCKDISPFAIVTLAKFYGVSTDYLLGVTENKNHPNTTLQELHLSDDMIDLLSSGKINNRLLCELATHPGFVQLLTDIEICVDRIADMRIRDMNLLLESTRQQILQRHAPADNDLYTRTLELAQVSEDIFYSHVIHDDLDGIVQNIRDAHVKDDTTADADTQTEATTEKVMQMWNEAMDYDGTMNQKRAHLFCSLMQLDYEKLPLEDQKAMERISQKSPLLVSAISQRGKAVPALGYRKEKRKKNHRRRLRYCYDPLK